MELCTRARNDQPSIRELVEALALEAILAPFAKRSVYSLISLEMVNFWWGARTGSLSQPGVLKGPKSIPTIYSFSDSYPGLCVFTVGPLSVF